MLLENKTAVIYAAGGAIGGAVARAFTREGARLFLTVKATVISLEGRNPARTHRGRRHPWTQTVSESSLRRPLGASAASDQVGGKAMTTGPSGSSPRPDPAPARTPYRAAEPGRS